MTGELTLSPQFEGPALGADSGEPEYNPRPAMEYARDEWMSGISRFFNDTGEFLMRPEVRPVTGAMAGMLGLVFAWKALPQLLGFMDNVPGGGILKGLTSFALAVTVGLALFEGVNNGFDWEKTGQNLARNFGVAVDGVGAAASAAGSAAGRMGEGIVDWAEWGAEEARQAAAEQLEQEQQLAAGTDPAAPAPGATG